MWVIHRTVCTTLVMTTLRGSFCLSNHALLSLQLHCVRIFNHGNNNVMNSPLGLFLSLSIELPFFSVIGTLLIYTAHNIIQVNEKDF